MDSEYTAFVSLGSNLGNRRAILEDAIRTLEKLSEGPVILSSFWRTKPVDCPPGSPEFMNAAAALAPEGETPESLLGKLQEMEREFGRWPKKVFNEPRVLDLDLIAFGSEVRNSPELVLPHPRAHLRRFVLEPLAEIAPELVLPGQKESVRELLANLRTDEVVERVR
jgi:2-amino-4-hydroxy-6-hydroxymethyldihydropteridine diphosphokinase